MKPIIGITSNSLDDDKYFIKQGLGALGQRFTVLANDYTDAVIEAGGIPIIIPISNDGIFNKDIVDSIDGLILSGGADIEPSLANQRITSKVGNISIERDSQEIEILDYIYKKTNKPILGICRGMQMLNVYFGGTLILDLPEKNLVDHAITRNRRYRSAHDIIIDESSKLFEIVGKKFIGVNSFHHQAIDLLGEDLKVVASSEDGVIEAIEHKDINNRYIIGVQWHPEMNQIENKVHLKIFEKLINETKKY